MNKESESESDLNLNLNLLALLLRIIVYYFKGCMRVYVLVLYCILVLYYIVLL